MTHAERSKGPHFHSTPRGGFPDDWPGSTKRRKNRRRRWNKQKASACAAAQAEDMTHYAGPGWGSFGLEAPK